MRDMYFLRPLDGKPEVVFVNIVGNFNPAYLANIGDQFDIDELDGVEVP